MAPLAEAFVRLRIDDSQIAPDVRKGLSKVDASGAGRKAGQSYGSAFGSSARKVIGGISALVAAAGIGQIIKESVSGFRDHQKVVAQTNAVLRSTKNAANTSVGAIGRLSDALERKSTVDGDVIQSGANMIATFTNVQNRVGKGNDIFNRAAATVLDMSVALGQDTTNSAIQLGKALNDPVKGVTALQRVGVTFTAEQKKQIATMIKAGDVAGAQKVILAELNKEFGGSAAAQGKAAGAQGRLTVAWRQAQDTIGAALLPVVNQLETALADRLPGAAEKFAAAVRSGDRAVKGFTAGLAGKGPVEGFSGKLNTLGLGVRALIAAYKEGDVTSTGFIGAMERIGVSLGRVRDYLKTVDFHTFAGDAKQVGTSLATIDVQGLATKLKSMDTSSLSDGMHVLGAALGFVADHVGLLVKALPLLLAGYAAYKAAEAAANVAALASIPVRAAQVGSNYALARSIKSLATANIEQVVAVGAAAGAETVKTAITGAGTAQTIRGTAVTLASAAAQRVATVATKAWTVGTFLLGAAVKFALGPLGLIITGVALAAAGIVFVATKTQFFQTMWRVAWGAVRTAFTATWEWIRSHWLLILGILTGPVGLAIALIVKSWDRIRSTFATMWDGLKHLVRVGVAAVVDFFLGMISPIVHGAARAFGWIPGIGGKLNDAAAAFDRFRDNTNNALLGVKDRTITVTASLGTIGGAHSVAQASGGIVRYFAAGTERHVAQIAPANTLRVWAEPETGGEAYIPLAPAKRGRSTAILSAVASSFGYGLMPMADGGLTVNPRVTGLAKFADAINRFNAAVDKMAASSLAGLGRVLGFAAQHVGAPYVWGGVGPGGWDCSGWISSLVNVALGRDPYHRLFSTASLPAGYFAPGLRGKFDVGWFQGNPGHVAGTVGGVNVESAGGVGVRIGAGARGAASSLFTHRGHLIGFAGGGILPGDPPFDLLDPRGRAYRPGLAQWLARIGSSGGGRGWVGPQWYGAGLPPTTFRSPTLIGVAERGPETVSVTPGSGRRTGGPLLAIEHFHAHDGIDVDLLASRLSFVARAGGFT